MDLKEIYQLLRVIYCIILSTAFFISLISFLYGYAKHLKLFSILLGITCIVEWLATPFVRQFIRWDSTSGLYNSFMLVEFMMYAWYYHFIIKIKWIKNVNRIFMILFPLFWLVTVVMIFGFNKWNSYVVVAGAVLSVCLSLGYFYQLIRDVKDIYLMSHPEFWIAAGMFTLYLAQIPYFGMLNYVYTHYLVAARYLSLTVLVLNIFMYLSFTYAFLCPKIIPTKR